MSLSEIRVNTTKTRTGVGTITYTETGPVITGIATASNFKTGSTNVHSTGVELANINTGGSTATFGGPISGTTASFSGNVSIGGTLTYEDVTNIDSVGIITATKGIDITAGTSNLYQTDGSLSYYAANNGVYLNGAGANGWLRLQAAGSANDRTSINLSGHSRTNGDEIYFKTNSTERLRIDSAGTVRIKRAVSTSLGNDSIFLAIGDTENGANVNRMIGFGYNSNFGTSVYPASMGYTETDNSGNTKGALTFNTRNSTGATDAPTERLRIASDGKVYFGDFASVGSKAYILKEVSGDYKFNIFASSSTTTNRIITINSRSNVEAMRIDTSGRILIGTTTEGAVQAGNVTVSGTGDVGITFRSTNSGTNRIFFSDATSGAGEYAGYINYIHSDNTMLFGTNENTRFRILSNGNVLMNGSSFDTGNFGSVQGLNVYGTQPLVLVNATGNGTSFFMGKTSSACYFGTSDAQPINFRVSDVDKMQLDANGNLLLGTASSRAVAGGYAKHQVESTSSEGISLTRTSADNGAPYLAFGKTRNGSVCQAGDKIGVLSWSPDDGTDLNHVTAAIHAEVVSGIGGNDVPGDLVFGTNSGTTSTTERLRITSGGGVKFIDADTPGSTNNPAQILNHSGGWQFYGSSAEGTHRNIIFGTNDRSAGERLRITSAGTVNIGGNYTQTNYMVQVAGDLLLQKSQAAYQHPQLEIYNSSNTAHGGAIKFSAYHSGSGGKYQEAVIKAYGGTGANTGSLVFVTGNNDDKMRMHSDGSIEFKNQTVANIRVDDANNTNGSGLKITIDNTEEFRFDPGSITYKNSNNQTRGQLLAPNNYYSNTNLYVDLTQWRLSDSWNILEVFGTVNPNSSGSGAYVDPCHFYIYRGHGWDSGVKHWLYCASVAPPARHAFPSGTGYAGNSGISAVWYHPSVGIRGNKSTSSTDYVRLLIPNANNGANFQKNFRVMRRF